MKIFKIDFVRFNRVDWVNVEYIIQAENLEQMRTSLLNVLKFCNLSHDTIEEECNILMLKVKETELEFPIIRENSLE